MSSFLLKLISIGLTLIRIFGDLDSSDSDAELVELHDTVGSVRPHDRAVLSH
jgi:hypothetical protein